MGARDKQTFYLVRQYTLGAGLCPVCEGRSTQFFAGIVQVGSQDHEKITGKFWIMVIKS